VGSSNAGASAVGVLLAIVTPLLFLGLSIGVIIRYLVWVPPSQRPVQFVSSTAKSAGGELPMADGNDSVSASPAANATPDHTTSEDGIETRGIEVESSMDDSALASGSIRSEDSELCLTPTAFSSDGKDRLAVEDSFEALNKPETDVSAPCMVCIALNGPRCYV
jgi:hypothetical protein